MQVSEGGDREFARRILPDAFENNIAQIVEQHPGKARAGIGDDQPDGQRDAFLHPRRHTVDRRAIDEAHRQLHRL